MNVSADAVTTRPATEADMDAVAAIYAHHVLRDVGYEHGVWLDRTLLQRSLGRRSTTPPCSSDG